MNEREKFILRNSEKNKGSFSDYYFSNKTE